MKSFIGMEIISNEQPQLLNDSTSNLEIKVIVCIDMDAFYASAEAVRMGYEDTVPVVVVQWRGCIAVSYAARKHGVSRFMQLEEIKQICPEVVFIHVDTIKSNQPYVDPYKRDLSEKFVLKRDRNKEKVNLDYYRFESDKVTSIFRKHSSIVEKASIDESFFDLTEEVLNIYNSGNYQSLWIGKIAGGNISQPETKEEILLMIGAQLTNKIRNDVYSQLKYTCSAGISFNKMLAKLASGLNKPNDQTVILSRFLEPALQPLQISKVRNFGGKIDEAFQAVGLKTLGDIRKLNLEELITIVNDENCAKWVYFRCRGFDDELVEEKNYTNKSLLSNKSFDQMVTNILDLQEILDLVVSDLHSRVLRYYNESSLVPGTLNVHYSDNKTHERRTKSAPINLTIKTEKFYEALKDKTVEIVKQISNSLFPCKFLGVSVKNFKKNDLKSYGFDLQSYIQRKNEVKNENNQQKEDANCFKDLQYEKKNTNAIDHNVIISVTSEIGMNQAPPEIIKVPDLLKS